MNLNFTITAETEDAKNVEKIQRRIQKAINASIAIAGNDFDKITPNVMRILARAEKLGYITKVVSIKEQKP